MRNRLTLMQGIIAAAATVPACGEVGVFDAELELDPQQSTIEHAEPSDERLAISAEMELSVDQASDVSIEDVTIKFGPTPVDALLVTSEDLPLEGARDRTQLTVHIEVPAPDWPDEFLRGCYRGDSVEIALTLQVSSNETAETRSPQATMSLPLVSNSPIPPNAFGTPGVIAVEDAFVSEAPVQLVAMADGDVVAVFGWNGYAVLRADADSVSPVATDPAWEEVRLTSASDGDVILGGRVGSFEIALLSVDENGSETGAGTISTAEWFAVEDSLRLATLGRSPSGAYAVVRSAAPLVVEGVEYPASSEVYYGSFVVQLDDALTPVSVAPMERDVLSWDALEDGSILSTSTPLPPSEDRSVDIERRASDMSVLWSYTPPGADRGTLRVRPLPDGGVLAAYEVFDGTERAGNQEVAFLRLASDGSVIWEHVAPGVAPSIGAREGGGAIVTYVGQHASLDFGSQSVPLLLEISPEGDVVRGAPLACRGSGVVIDRADGSTLLVGAYTERVTLGDTNVDVDQGQLVVAGVD